MSKQATNEEIREMMERQVKAEETVSTWIKAHAGDENPPVRWRWADPTGIRGSGIKDALEDVVIERRDGTKFFTTPGDLREELREQA